jgi:hypothetical protein
VLSVAPIPKNPRKFLLEERIKVAGVFQAEPLLG